jgi:uncharacterized membrane protein YtjA (UPF0391 family)
MFAKAEDRQVPYPFRKDSIPLLEGQVRPQTAGKVFRKDSVKESRGSRTMLYDALIFLLIGSIAGALGLFGIAAVEISRVFLVGIILLVVHLAPGRGASRMP